MTPKHEKIVFNTLQANNMAEGAYWWMKDINASDVDDLSVMKKIEDVLKILRKVDDLTMDIIITIRNKEK